MMGVAELVETIQHLMSCRFSGLFYLQRDKQANDDKHEGYARHGQLNMP